MAAPTRREVLGALASGSAALGGCTALGGQRIRVLVAGSLQQAASQTLQDRTERTLAVEARGSVQAARLVAEGKRNPDVLALADPTLFGDLLSTPWYAVFASNELVVAYNPDTEAGRRIGDADAWYEPLGSPAVALGRTDPALDPLGYRTVLLLRLAADYYDEPGLADRVLEPDQRYPETQLLAQFETGSVDAAVVYRSMAVERDYPFRELPPEIHLGDPSRTDEYARVSYELPGGTVVRGDAIEYAATRLTDSAPVRTAFRRLVTGEWLGAHGFTGGPQYPRLEGDVPDTVTG